MSLRLDDMNVKENHLRLSLSSLDHRMNRIDDLENSLDEAIRIIKLMSSKEVHGSQESLDVSSFNKICILTIVYLLYC